MKIKTGRFTKKHAVLIGVLLIALYAVFPASSAPSGSQSDGNSASHDSMNAPEAAHSAPQPANAPDAGSAVDSAETVSQRLQPLADRLAALTDGQLQELISTNPFFTVVSAADASTDSSNPATGTTESETSVISETAVRPLVEDLAGAATVSLLYSSSRGTSATIVDGQVLRPGEATISGLRVKAIDDRGIDVIAAAEDLP